MQKCSNSLHVKSKKAELNSLLELSSAFSFRQDLAAHQERE